MYSILLSVYFNDNSFFLEECFQSLTNQTLPPSEVVVIQDGFLSPQLEAVIKLYHNKLPLKVIKLSQNQGLGKALTIGLEQCTFELIGRMDADDLCISNRFEMQYDYLKKHPDVAVVGSSLEEFRNSPGDLNRYRTLPTEHNQLVKFSKNRNPLNHPTVMFRKSVIQSLGAYQHCLLFEDYLLWLKVIDAGYKIHNMHQSLLYFRIGSDMIGRRHGWRYLLLEYDFYRTAVNSGLLSWSNAMFAFTTRAPFRLLPKSLLSLFYKTFLRK